jgi:hypothetical protein
VGERRYRGACPFHEGANVGAFAVSYHRKHGWGYHCFNCGVRGDAIDALVALERLTFRQAVERLGALDLEPVDIWSAPKKAYELVCDRCRDERVSVDVADLPWLETWEMPPDVVAALGPKCLTEINRPRCQ